VAITYKKAGIDVAKIKKTQASIGKIIKATHRLQKIAKVSHGFGHYAGIVQIPGGQLLATHTDGVGTKVIIANMPKKYTTVENIEEVCVQCQAGQHKNCLAKSKQQDSCECELCIING